MRSSRLALCSTLLLTVQFATAAIAQPAYPHLRIFVPANPGGGWDVNARAMQPALHATGRVKTSSVENVPGAGGTIGLARFVSAERGNSDVVMLSGLTMLGAIMTYGSILTLADVTPIARVISEYEVVVVPDPIIVPVAGRRRPRVHCQSGVHCLGWRVSRWLRTNARMADGRGSGCRSTTGELRGVCRKW